MDNMVEINRNRNLVCPHTIVINGFHGDVRPSCDKNNMQIMCPYQGNVDRNSAFAPEINVPVADPRFHRRGQPAAGDAKSIFRPKKIKQTQEFFFKSGQ